VDPQHGGAKESIRRRVTTTTTTTITITTTVTIILILILILIVVVVVVVVEEEEVDVVITVDPQHGGAKESRQQIHFMASPLRELSRRFSITTW
jgi:short subunit fatty acids transporter